MCSKLNIVLENCWKVVYWNWYTWQKEDIKVSTHIRQTTKSSECTVLIKALIGLHNVFSFMTGKEKATLFRSIMSSKNFFRDIFDFRRGFRNTRRGSPFLKVPQKMTLIMEDLRCNEWSKEKSLQLIYLSVKTHSKNIIRKRIVISELAVFV